jgi:eukaryotic-like serine/threonine-protein kinase
MLTESGQVKLLDFGVARHLTAASRVPETAATQSLSSFASVGGTPSYMAPEVLMGNLLDFRADVFSLGLVLLSVICPPFA